MISKSSLVWSVFSSSGCTCFIAWSNSVNVISPLILVLMAMNYSFASVTNSWSARDNSSHKTSMQRCWKSSNFLTCSSYRTTGPFSGGCLTCFLIHGWFRACSAVILRLTTGSSKHSMKSNASFEVYSCIPSNSKSQVLIFLKSFSSLSAMNG